MSASRSRPGEVLALLGENGAGKTTLMNILFGHYVPDEGRVVAFGRELPHGSPRAALDAGIGMVHQHFTLAANLTVLENIMLGTEPLPGSPRAGQQARRKLAAHRRAIRPRGRSRRPRRRPRRRRAPARRDPEGALPRRPRPHPRRADRGADAAGGRRLFDTLRVMAERGPRRHLHHPQARARCSRVSDRIVVLRHGRVVAERDRRTPTRPNSPS